MDEFQYEIMRSILADNTSVLTYDQLESYSTELAFEHAELSQPEAKHLYLKIAQSKFKRLTAADLFMWLMETKHEGLISN